LVGGDARTPADVRAGGCRIRWGRGSGLAPTAPTSRDEVFVIDKIDTLDDLTGHHDET